ncbi:MAG: hypothetical protein PHR36_02680 [Patescibacteria group bacterium]|nr:hypothetical protein [Patescibacteria group bacterium]
MEQLKTYENYPGCIIFASNSVSLAIYFIGAFIISKIGLIWLGLYLLYIVGLEIRLMKGHCPNCYYYEKNCAFGKGKISSWFFKKGDPNNFTKNKITFKDILPDFLVSLIPLAVGLVLLILNFSWLILILIILLVILASSGSGFVRKNLACKFCKQREIGCPAEQLFNKRG